jgi:hypothetical protein
MVDVIPETASLMLAATRTGPFEAISLISGKLKNGTPLFFSSNVFWTALPVAKVILAIALL